MGPYQGSDCYDDGIYISQGPVRKGEATLVWYVLLEWEIQLFVGGWNTDAW